MMDRFFIILAAFGGGLVVALLGWCESHETFDARKFGGSAIRAFVAAVLFAVGYHLSGPVGLLDCFYAFLGGAGVDALGNRIAGSFGKGSFPIPSKKKTPE